jgi:GT2 family glycosyltransferase
LLSEQKQIIETDNLSSGFFAIKACVFGEIDGFNGSLSIGEDSEISYRLRANGYRLAKSNKIIVYNSGHPKTVRQFVRREIWHGDSFKHLMMHKNVDLLTIYFIVNCLLWASLILGLIYIKSYGFIFTNIAFIVAVPIYKAIIKVKGFNNNLLKLIVIYTLYAASRSLALFKLR